MEKNIKIPHYHQPYPRGKVFDKHYSLTTALLIFALSSISICLMVIMIHAIEEFCQDKTLVLVYIPQVLLLYIVVATANNFSLPYTIAAIISDGVMIIITLIKSIQISIRLHHCITDPIASLTDPLCIKDSLTPNRDGLWWIMLLSYLLLILQSAIMILLILIIRNMMAHFNCSCLLVPIIPSPIKEWDCASINDKSHPNLIYRHNRLCSND